MAKYQNIKSLSDALELDIKIGTTLGVEYSSEHKKLLKLPNYKARVIESERYFKSFDLLFKNRIDAVITSQIGGYTFVN